MKKDIHPVYFADAKTTCACGNVIEAGTSQQELMTEICSACHPFFTGKQKLIDTAGRVDKFRARQKAAEAKQPKQEVKAEVETEVEELEQGTQEAVQQEVK